MYDESDHEKAMVDLGVTADLLSPTQTESLDREGYLVVPGFIDPSWLEELRTAFDSRVQAEGEDAGKEFKVEVGATRLANCADKGPAFERAFSSPELLAAAGHIIKRPFRLNSFNAREPRAGEGHQALHADDPEPNGLMNSLWLLDDFTPDNGATRIVPGSHLKPWPVTEELADPADDHPQQLVLQARSGSVIVFNGHVWHGGTRNVSGARRRVLHISFVYREHPQQTDQRAMLSTKTIDRLSWPQRYLLDV